ncbi:MAG: PilZN3 domain-containing protein [Treponema sp.]
MGFATSQQLNKYYESFQNSELTFTKEVIQAMDFNTQQVNIRCAGEKGGPWSCVINSASMVAAKIIVAQHCGIYDKIKDGVSSVSLRFSFFARNGKTDISFFVAGKIVSCIPYTVSPDLLLINIEYTQRAPDDLIEKLGLLLDAKASAALRSNERIELTPDVMRRLSLAERETIVYIENIPRRCILRDISLSGAKLIIAGVAPFLLNKDCVLKCTFEDPAIVIGIRGKIIRAEMVERRKDLVAVAVNYNPSLVPLAYKVRLTQYFNQQRKTHSYDDFTMPF